MFDREDASGHVETSSAMDDGKRDRAEMQPERVTTIDHLQRLLACIPPFQFNRFAT